VPLVDQIPCNVFRGGRRAYPTGVATGVVADRALARGFDRLVSAVRRRFFRVPFHRREQLACPERGQRLLRFLIARF
jgi:uncharacterized protein (DUF924 family)